MYTIDEIKNTIIHGNCIDILKKIPSNSIDCVVTSSPYYGLRSYDTAPQIWGGEDDCNHQWGEFIRKGISGGTKSSKVQIKDKENFQIVSDSKQAYCSLCGAWKGELGQEPTHIMFVEHLTEIFMECVRTLKPKGTMFINIADSYSGSNQGNGAPPSGKNATNRGTSKMQIEGHKSILAKSDVARKSLMGVPDRLKIALIDNGLICRNQIIWHKPNQMPSSAKDRFTTDYEPIYFFAKNENYYFEQQLEPYTKPMNRWGGEKLDAKGESAWDKGTGQSSYRTRDFRPNKDGKNMRTVWSINTKGVKEAHFATFPEELPKRCILAGCPENGIVLDPFFGSGTSGLVAQKNNRNWIGIDLNPEYIEIAKRRLGIENGIPVDMGVSLIDTPYMVVEN